MPTGVTGNLVKPANAVLFPVNMLGIWALVAGAVTVAIAEYDEMPREDALAIANALQKAVRDKTGQAVSMEDMVWIECNEPGGCTGKIIERSKADHVLILSIFGGTRNIHLELQHVRPGQPKQRLSTNLALKEKPWQRPIALLVDQLFPTPITRGKITAIDQPSPQPPSSSNSQTAIWALAGTSATAFLVGLGFGISSWTTHASTRSGSLEPDEFERLHSRAGTHAIIANLLFGVASVAVAATITVGLLE